MLLKRDQNPKPASDYNPYSVTTSRTFTRLVDFHDLIQMTVMVTYDREALSWTDRILFMVNGRIIHSIKTDRAPEP